MGWNMPAGCFNPPRSEVVLFKCENPECGELWEVLMYYELGGWTWEREKDITCPVCGELGWEA
jgi:hypothetical protein